jgi:acyl-CoA dehydrogenase
LWQRIAVGLAGVQAGVTEAALRLAADYTSGRKQFEKPLSSFQGVSHKLADGYIDNVAIRSTMLQAAWHLDQGHEAVEHVLTAGWWAAEGGQRCVHITQHVHGGIGADITYPVHRYFLWGKQLEAMLGPGSALLARLGDALVDLPDAGDAVTV